MTFGGFITGDTIDISDLAHGAGDSAIYDSLCGRVTVAYGSGSTLAIQLDPTINYRTAHFTLANDLSGGTTLRVDNYSAALPYISVIATAYTTTVTPGAGAFANVVTVTGTGSITPAGESLHDVAASILASDEYTLRSGDYRAGSDDGFVQHLYATALGRAADPAGEAYWDGQLAGGASRVDVAISFALSVENKIQIAPALTAGLYQNGLGRSPDPAGSQFFTGLLAQGATRAGVALGLVQSAEAQIHLAAHVEGGWHSS